MPGDYWAPGFGFQIVKTVTEERKNNYLNLCSAYLKASEFWPCGCWLRQTLPCSLEQTEDLCHKISHGTKSQEIQQELLSASILLLHCLWGKYCTFDYCIFLTALVLFTFEETSFHSFLSGEKHVSPHVLNLNVVRSWESPQDGIFYHAMLHCVSHNPTV